VRLAAWTGTRVGRAVSGIALAFIWFGFVAQIYISEFLNYHGALGWLNQPLVQLPWFHYLPTRLKNPFEELFLSILAVLLIVLAARIIRAMQAAIRLKKSRVSHLTSDP
jgi:succinate dehydrogenase hydrophobic anchor subunit